LYLLSPAEGRLPGWLLLLSSFLFAKELLEHFAFRRCFEVDGATCRERDGRSATARESATTKKGRSAPARESAKNKKGQECDSQSEPNKKKRSHTRGRASQGTLDSAGAKQVQNLERNMIVRESTRGRESARGRARISSRKPLAFPLPTLSLKHTQTCGPGVPQQQPCLQGLEGIQRLQPGE